MTILACYGLMCLLKYGSILNKPRSFICNIHPSIKELFKCSLCLGFWAGVIITVCNLYIFKTDTVIYLPLISSGVCWFLDCTLRTIQTVEIYLDKKLEDMK